jgi:hypothetical protein
MDMNTLHIIPSFSNSKLAGESLLLSSHICSGLSVTFKVLSVNQISKPEPLTSELEHLFFRFLGNLKTVSFLFTDSII